MVCIPLLPWCLISNPRRYKVVGMWFFGNKKWGRVNMKEVGEGIYVMEEEIRD